MKKIALKLDGEAKPWGITPEQRAKFNAHMEQLRKENARARAEMYANFGKNVLTK